MGKWAAFAVSLIPAGLAGYLCYLLVTIGLPIVDEGTVGSIIWGPLGAGFLGCAMCMLTPFGIAIFVRSAPAAAKAAPSEDLDLSGEQEEFISEEMDEFDSEDDLASSDFDSDDDLAAADFDSDDEFGASSDFESADLASDDFSEELDEFDFDDDDDDLLS